MTTEAHAWRAEEHQGAEDYGMRFQGTVVSFQKKRGFGLIQPPSEEEEPIFVHWSQIMSSGKWPHLPPGMLVEYTPSLQHSGRVRAANVTLPGGGLIADEADSDSAGRTLSDFTIVGEVVEFDRRTGEGWIVSEMNTQVLPAGSMIMVSREELAITEGSSCTLLPKMKVEFKVYQTAEGVRAAEVTLPGGEPISVDRAAMKGMDKGKGKFKGKGKGKGKFKGKGKDKGKGFGMPHITFTVPGLGSAGAIRSSSARPDAAREPLVRRAIMKPSAGASAAFAASLAHAGAAPGGQVSQTAGQASQLSDQAAVDLFQASVESVPTGAEHYPAAAEEWPGSWEGWPGTEHAPPASAELLGQAWSGSSGTWPGAEYFPEGEAWSGSAGAWPGAEYSPAGGELGGAAWAAGGEAWPGAEHYPAAAEAGHGSWPPLAQPDSEAWHSMAERASMDLVNNEAFLKAPPKEQAQAINIMEQAMQQAADAQAKLVQAQALLRSGGRPHDPAPAADAGQTHGTFSWAMAQLQQQAHETKRVKQVPCKFFSQGRCAKGDQCEFSHDPEMYRPKLMDQKKPVLCTFFEQGNCIRGEACPFAHGQEELSYIEQLKGIGRGI